MKSRSKISNQEQNIIWSKYWSECRCFSHLPVVCSLPLSNRVCACIETCNGEYTEPVPFATEQCEPDRPSPPKLLGSRLKNSLTLKWPAAADNGSKILNYVLEYDEVSGVLFRSSNYFRRSDIRRAKAENSSKYIAGWKSNFCSINSFRRRSIPFVWLLRTVLDEGTIVTHHIRRHCYSRFLFAVNLVNRFNSVP